MLDDNYCRFERFSNLFILRSRYFLKGLWITLFLSRLPKAEGDQLNKCRGLWASELSAALTPLTRTNVQM